MKKILFYLPSLSPAGGIERVVSTIANKLSGNYRITILTKDNLSSFYTLDESIKIRSLNVSLILNMNSKLQRIMSYGVNVFASIVKLREFFKSEDDFDFIYITHPVSHLELLLASVCHNKIVISEHGASNNYNVIYRAIKRLTYKKCHAYCVPTKLDVVYYRRFGYPVVYSPHYRPTLRYRHADLDARVVLNIGRFTPDKDQLTLIKIWHSISQDIKDGWVLKIIGTGELELELRDYVSHHGLESSISIESPKHDVEEFYEAASIFALTSRSEGFGMVLLEAAGFGLPLIAFDCPSGPRDIVNNENGFLIPEGDLLTYEDRLSQMMVERDFLRKLSSGSLHLSDKWSDYNITKIWEKVFS